MLLTCGMFLASQRRHVTPASAAHPLFCKPSDIRLMLTDRSGFVLWAGQDNRVVSFMFGVDESACHGAPAIYSGRLDRYREVINAAIRRRSGCEDKVLAAELNMDRSYFSKMRRGLRPISPRVVDHLVDRLELDRVRLALAVNMMDDPLVYFDPAFKNICAYMKVIITDTMRMAKATGDEQIEFHIGTLSADRCEALAQAAVEQLRDQFTALGAVPVSPQHRRAGHHPPG